jgi:hypothetical protein
MYEWYSSILSEIDDAGENAVITDAQDHTLGDIRKSLEFVQQMLGDQDE